MAFLVIRMGAEESAEEGEHVKTLQVPLDAAAVQVAPGLFLTPLGKGIHARVAPRLTSWYWFSHIVNMPVRDR